MTAPGCEGARQSRRPLPAARAPGPGRALTWAGGEGGLRVGTGPRRERAPQSPPAASARRGEGGRPAGRASELAARGCGGGGGRGHCHRAHSAPGAGERVSGRPRLALARASPHGRDPRPSGGDSAPPPTRGYAARAANCVESAAAAAGDGDARSHVSPRSGPRAPVPLALQASPASRAPAARGPSPSPAPPRVAPGPRPACSPPAAPPPSPLDARAASGSQRTGGAGRGRGGACTSGTREPARAEPGRSGRGDLPQDGAPEQSGAGAAAERRT